MVTETVKYVDYNGVERTEQVHFNYTKAEIMEMEMSQSGGMAEMMQRIVDAKDTPSLFKVVKELVLGAYGEKSADGKYFMKKDANGVPLSLKFEQTEAYSQIFMKVATDDEYAMKFIMGAFPSELVEEANKQGALAALTAK